MDNTIRYELTKPLEYALKGDLQTASFIELRAPTSRNMTECAALKQAFCRALPDTENATDSDREGKEVSEITGQDIMGLILRSKDVELITVLLHARKLFSNVGFIDGEVRLNNLLMDDIDPDDFENMVGEYLARFTLASMLQRMNKK